MSFKKTLEDAAARAKMLPQQPNDVLLELYGLYKQATQGDVAGDAPGLFDFVAKAKYEAWSARKGMSQDAAAQAYVDLVDRLSNA